MKQNTEDLRLTFKEKIELAKLLDKLGVDLIELDGIKNPRVDALLIKSIVSAVSGSRVAVPIELLNEENLNRTWAALKDAKIDERQFDRIEAIILSMTPKDREKPDIINASRKKRIADGCGMKVEDVNRLLKQYDQMRQMMKKLSSMTGGKRFGKMSKMKLPF